MLNTQYCKNNILSYVRTTNVRIYEIRISKALNAPLQTNTHKINKINIIFYFF